MLSYGLLLPNGWCIYIIKEGEENGTEENFISTKKTTGPGWPWNEMDCGAHKKILVCDYYISYCCPIVWFVYIYTYIYFALHKW